jgi:uncharacterized protein YjcR
LSRKTRKSGSTRNAQFLAKSLENSVIPSIQVQHAAPLRIGRFLKSSNNAKRPKSVWWLIKHTKITTVENYLSAQRVRTAAQQI